MRNYIFHAVVSASLLVGLVLAYGQYRETSEIYSAAAQAAADQDVAQLLGHWAHKE